MEPSFLSPPAKRPYSTTTTMQENGSASKRNRSKPPQPPLPIPHGHVSLRLLCHVTKIGGVIGKSGSVVKIFRQETGAKIRIEEPVTACDERIILIVAPENPKKKLILKGLNEVGVESGEEVEVSPAQEALIRIFERILDVEAESEGIFPPLGEAVSCRLLAATSQVGAVMGKGGRIIEKLRKESGARIRVLPSDQLPACASLGDEVIQVLGDVLAVKKALIAISCCLQDNPPTEKAQVAGSRPVRTIPGTFPEIYEEIPHRSSVLPPSLSSAVDYASRADYAPRGLLHTLGSAVDYASMADYAPRGLPSTLGNAVDYASRADYAPRGRPVRTESDRFSAVDPNKQQEIVFRLLCSTDIVGGVIGKGGTIVRALQEETGATISVASSVSETDERVITVSAKENPESRYSPAQNAVVRVFTRSVEAGIEKGLDAGSNKGASARLLVATKEVGCLMGKGGTIIQEMRKLTGTSIRIIGNDKVPKCASENDQVVQIIGEFRNVQDAVFHITGRLRDNLFPNKTFNGAGPGSYPSSANPDISPYGRLREPTSPGMYPHLGLSRNDRQYTITQGMDHLGLSHSLDRPRSPQMWTTQTLGGGDLRGISDTGRGLTSLRGDLDFGRSGGKSAIVTNTTVEILVPEQVLGSVYGDNGSNLNRLRQISGAKVVMHDSHPGTSEAIVIISGTPDQTQAAQSLLQAFILSGQS